VNFAKSFYQLFEVVACYRLFKSPSLRQDHKEVSLVCWENEVGAFVSFELHTADVIARYNIFMLHSVENLALISCFVNLCLLLFVKLDENLSQLAILFVVVS